MKEEVLKNTTKPKNTFFFPSILVHYVKYFAWCIPGVDVTKKHPLPQTERDKLVLAALHLQVILISSDQVRCS